VAFLTSLLAAGATIEACCEEGRSSSQRPRSRSLVWAQASSSPRTAAVPGQYVPRVACREGIAGFRQEDLHTARRSELQDPEAAAVDSPAAVRRRRLRLHVAGSRPRQAADVAHEDRDDLAVRNEAVRGHSQHGQVRDEDRRSAGGLILPVARARRHRLSRTRPRTGSR
jgi:hypothetical protein